MPKPTTRQDSSSKTTPRKTLINTNLIDLSGKGSVRVASRGLLPTKSRGRGSTPLTGRATAGKVDSVDSQSSTSIRATRGSSVASSFASYQTSGAGEINDDKELPVGTSSDLGIEPLEVTTVSETSDSQEVSNMATGGTEAQGDNQTSGGAMEDILTYFREALRTTQDEFRRELAALRESMGTSGNNRSNSATPGLHSQASGSQAQASSYATFSASFKLKDWKISYNGEGSVSDFLFKLDTLVERSQCPHGHLMANFHIFLTGKAETFYWDFIRQCQGATYPMLKSALVREFGSRESDHEILLKLSTRKQLTRESYDDYHSFMVRWNLRLSNPMSETSLIEIMKKNVNPELKIMLFISEPRDLNNLRDLARKAEKVLLENRNTSRQRQVNEIVGGTAIPEIPDEESDLDPQVEAMKMSRTWTNGDYSRIKCWNCLQLGHSYIYCPEETRNVFCYKCGKRGVTTVKCDGAHVGNRRRSEWTTGDARSSN